MRKLLVIHIQDDDIPAINLWIDDEPFDIILNTDTDIWEGGPDYVKCLKVGNLIMVKVITPDGDDKDIVCMNEEHLLLEPMELFPLVSLGAML